MLGSIRPAEPTIKMADEMRAEERVQPLDHCDVGFRTSELHDPFLHVDAQCVADLDGSDITGAAGPLGLVLFEDVLPKPFFSFCARKFSASCANFPLAVPDDP